MQTFHRVMCSFTNSRNTTLILHSQQRQLPLSQIEYRNLLNVCWPCLICSQARWGILCGDGGNPLAKAASKSAEVFNKALHILQVWQCKMLNEFVGSFMVNPKLLKVYSVSFHLEDDDTHHRWFYLPVYLQYCMQAAVYRRS